MAIIIVKCTYTYDIEQKLNFLYISGMPRLWVQTMLPVSNPNLTLQSDCVRVDRRTAKEIKWKKSLLFYGIIDNRFNNIFRDFLLLEASKRNST